MRNLLNNLLRLVLFGSLAILAEAQADCPCHAVNARSNVSSAPRSGYDFIPVVPDDSVGFYVVYSAKQNDSNTDIGGTSCIYLFELDNGEVLVFGGGFGDTWYIPGGAFFDADYDAAHIDEVITGCMGLDRETTKLNVVTPHGHPDHMTVAFVRAVERAGYGVREIAYHAGDRGWIEQLPWDPHHPSLFNVLPAGLPCGSSLGVEYDGLAGHMWFVSRPGHTTGAVDLVVDVQGSSANRILIRGSLAGGSCSAPPPNVHLTLNAHSTQILPGVPVTPAEATPIGGRGINRMCMTTTTLPQVNTTWTLNLSAEGHPGATSVHVLGYDCRLDSGLMLQAGELLINARSRVVLRADLPVTGNVTRVDFAIPNDPTLVGKVAYLQGVIAGGGTELCNAMRVVIGL